MDHPDRPEKLAPQDSAEARLQAWLELKARLQQLHAELEYVRLLIRLGNRAP
jgi:hypothetical protein